MPMSDNEFSELLRRAHRRRRRLADAELAMLGAALLAALIAAGAVWFWRAQWSYDECIAVGHSEPYCRAMSLELVP